MSENHSKRTLPPLRSLEVFEAAARHANFTEAASELAVTQGAVSRQIQLLESRLGLKLFERAGPRLRLTAAGEELAQATGRALDILEAALDAAAPRSGAAVLTVSMLPSVASKWLAPRLGGFLSRHPDIDLRVSAARRLVDFAREGVDAGLRYGKGRWPGLEAEFLGAETVFPVCAPAYAARLSLNAPADLARAALLHSDILEDWRAWLGAVGLEPPTDLRGPRLAEDGASIQAAIEGQGVALSRSRLVERDLDAGRLVAPFAYRLPAAYSYWLVWPESARPSAAREAFLAWALEAFSDAPAPPTA